MFDQGDSGRPEYGGLSDAHAAAYGYPPPPVASGGMPLAPLTQSAVRPLFVTSATRQPLPGPPGFGGIPMARVPLFQTPPVMPSPDKFRAKEVNRLYGREERVTVTNVSDEGPRSFFVVLEEDKLTLELIENTIASVTQDCERMMDLSLPRDFWNHSKLALCYSPTNNRWARVVVKKTSGETAEVFQVDYGLKEYVPIKSLHRLPHHLMTMPAIAIHCRLESAEQLEMVTCSATRLAVDFRDIIRASRAVSCIFLPEAPTVRRPDVSLLDAPVRVNVFIDGKPAVSLLTEKVISRSAPFPTLPFPNAPDSLTPRMALTFAPALSTTEKIILTNFSDFDDFFGQLKSLILLGAADRLKEELAVVYANYIPGWDNAFTEGLDPVGQFGVVLWREEFHRCKILSHVMEKREATVYLVDTGKTIKIHTQLVYRLGPETLSLPVLGIRCCAPDFVDKQLTMEQKAGLEGIEVEVNLRPKTALNDVTMQIDVEIPKSIENQDFWNVVEAGSILPCREVPPQAIREVFLSHPGSTGEFYLGLTESAMEFSALKTALKNTKVEDLVPYTPKIVGTACLYLRGTNELLFRAVVESVTPMLKIKCVDFGMVAEVSSADKLYQMTVDLARFPIQAFRCSSAMGLPFRSATDHAFARFLNCVNGVWEVEFLELSSMCAASREVQRTRTIEQIKIEAGTTKDVFVVWFRSPGSLFVQLAENQALVDELGEKLQNLYESGKGNLYELAASDLSKGALVATKFEDGFWYRSEIVNCGCDKATVLYVDYGNDHQVPVNEIRALDDQFFSLPKQAVVCGLEGLRPAPSGGKPEAPADYWNAHFAGVKFRGTFHRQGANQRWEVSLVAPDGRQPADTICRDGYAVRTDAVIPRTTQRNFEGRARPPKALDEPESGRRPPAKSLNNCYEEGGNRRSQVQRGPRGNRSGIDGAGDGRRVEGPGEGRDGGWKNFGRSAQGNSRGGGGDGSKTFGDVQSRAEGNWPRKNDASPGPSWDSDNLLSPTASDSVPAGRFKNAKSSSVSRAIPPAYVAEKLGQHITNYKEIDFGIGERSKHSVYVSHVEDGRDVFLQLNTQWDAIEQINTQAEEAAQNGKVRKGEWKRDDPCVALWPEGDEAAAWYRAKVLADDGGSQVLVEFVDFGNSSPVSRRCIYEIPEALLKTCPQAIPARLEGLGRNTPKEKLMDMIFNESFDAIFGERVGRRWFVTLKKEDGTNVSDVLIGGNHKVAEFEGCGGKEGTGMAAPKVDHVPAQRRSKEERVMKVILAHSIPQVQPELKTLTPVFISTARSVNDIWFQAVGAEDTLCRVLASLRGLAAAAPSKYLYKVGELCAVIHEDGAVYRAEVRATGNRRMTLFLVDYGDIIETDASNVRDILDENLLAVPRQAFGGRIECVDQVLEVFDEVTPEMMAKFAGVALVELGNTEPVDVIFSRTEGEIYSVEGAALVNDLIKKVEALAGVVEITQEVVGTPVVTDVTVAPESSDSVAAEVQDTPSLSPPAKQSDQESIKSSDDVRLGRTAEATGSFDPAKLELPLVPVPAKFTHIVSPAEFYVIPETYGRMCDVVSEALKTSSQPVNEEPQLGDIYALKNESGLVRVEILDGGLSRLIDRGIVAEYRREDLLKLKSGSYAATVPPLAVKGHLTGIAAPVGGRGVPEWPPVAIELFKNSLTNAEQTMVTFCHKASVCAIRIDADNNDVADYLIENGFGVRALLPIPLCPGMNKGFLGSVNLAEKPPNVVFYREEDRLLLDRMAFNLKINTIFSDERLTEYPIGGYCAVRIGIEDTDDEKWVRAQIRTEDSDELVVYAVDSCEELTVSKDAVRPLPIGFFQSPIFGTRCMITLGGDDRKDGCAKLEAALSLLSKRACDFNNFVVIVEEKDLGLDPIPAKVCKESDGNLVDFLDYVAQLSEEPRPVVSVPKPLEFKERMVKVPSQIHASVVHVDNPNRFWLVLEDDDVALEKLAGDLLNFYSDIKNKKQPDVIEEGVSCVVAFPEGSFVRGKVLDKAAVGGRDKPNLIPIKAVDYGTVHCAARADIFEADAKLLEEPVFALQCQLRCSVAAESGEWSVEALEAFEEILGSDPGDRKFDVMFLFEMMSDDGSLKYVVDLLDAAGSSVTQRLHETGFTGYRSETDGSAFDDKSEISGRTYELEKDGGTDDERFTILGADEEAKEVSDAATTSGATEDEWEDDVHENEEERKRGSDNFADGDESDVIPTDVEKSKGVPDDASDGTETEVEYNEIPLNEKESKEVPDVASEGGNTDRDEMLLKVDKSKGVRDVFPSSDGEEKEDETATYTDESEKTPDSSAKGGEVGDESDEISAHTVESEKTPGSTADGGETGDEWDVHSTYTVESKKTSADSADGEETGDETENISTDTEESEKTPNGANDVETGGVLPVTEQKKPVKEIEARVPERDVGDADQKVDLGTKAASKEINENGDAKSSDVQDQPVSSEPKIEGPSVTCETTLETGEDTKKKSRDEGADEQGKDEKDQANESTAVEQDKNMKKRADELAEGEQEKEKEEKNHVDEPMAGEEEKNQKNRAGELTEGEQEKQKEEKNRAGELTEGEQEKEKEEKNHVGELMAGEQKKD